MRILVAALPLLFLGIGLGQTPDAAAPSAPSANHLRATGLLKESMQDKNPDTRKHTVQAMGLIGPREPYVSQVASMLYDKDVEVRVAAIISMVDLKNEARTRPATAEIVIRRATSP